MAWTLCSREDVAQLHQIDSAILVDSWSDMVESMIALHLGEDGLVSGVTYTGELYSGDGTAVLILRHAPISSVASITTTNGSTWSSGDYRVARNTVMLKDGMTFPQGTLNISVTYTTGGTVNSQVRLCASAMVAAIANHSGRHGADTSLKWASLPIDLGDQTPNEQIGLISHLYQIMKQQLKRNRLRIR